jgi:hypothetical protein
VNCGTGEVASGGGFDAPNAVIQSSMPTTFGNGWSISFSGRTSGAVTVYAICVAGTSS